MESESAENARCLLDRFVPGDAARADADVPPAKRSDLIEAAALSLVEAVRSGHPMQAGDPARLERARGALGAGSDSCVSAAGCIVSARIELLREEQSRPAERATDLCPGRHRQCAHDRLADALAMAAWDGPTFATAEAWMALAELEPEGGSLNKRHVLKAFETLKAVLAQDRGSSPTSSVARNVDLFRHRLLPIFQASADAIAFERVSEGSTLTDSALLAPLLDLGETARRAQIELVLADACEPLQLSLAPEHLLAGETIVYPIVGSRRTYLLVGRKPEGSGRKPAGKGWMILPAGPESGAKNISNIANALIRNLPEAASQYVKAGPDRKLSDWNSGAAISLYKMLISPMDRFLPKSGPAVGEPADTFIFFPDPVLRNVPWALLHPGLLSDRAGPDYLVRRVAIAIGPALAYVRPSPRPDYRGRLAIGGVEDDFLTDFVSAVTQEKDIIPWTASALFGPAVSQAVGAGSEGDQVGPIRKGPFTRERIEVELKRGDFSTLLLATHARYLHGTSFFLIHANSGTEVERMSVDAIEERLHEGRRKARALDLLIFLACEGAAGGAGDLGLAGAALRGGALSTVGSLTQIEAEPAQIYFNRTLMGQREDFLSLYYDARTPQSAAQALRRVQMSHIGTEAKPPSNHDPAFPANWGVLVVIGNWR